MAVSPPDTPSDPSAGPEAQPSAPDRPTCSCGFDRDHLMVSPEPVYSGWKTFWVIFMGVSAVPEAVEFRCRVCQEVFDRTDDPSTRNKTL